MNIQSSSPTAAPIVTPARYGSTRLIGKPLLIIAGKPMIQHVVGRTCASNPAEVVVVTDDERIFAVCAAFGVQTQLTAAEHHSGSDRIAEVIAQRDWVADIVVINLSRAPLPWHRDEFMGKRTHLPTSVIFMRYIGLYGYRAGFLQHYVTWAPSPLELAESLAQLRVLWYGEHIQVGLAVEKPGAGVDTAQELQRVAALLGDDSSPLFGPRRNSSVMGYSS